MNDDNFKRTLLIIVFYLIAVKIRDFGFGKAGMEELISEEVKMFVEEVPNDDDDDDDIWRPYDDDDNMYGDLYDVNCIQNNDHLVMINDGQKSLLSKI